MRLLLTANGPGELLAWAAPLLARLEARGGFTTEIVLWPCRFASGREPELAATLPTVSSVVPPAEAIRGLLCRRPGASFAPTDVLLHIGGEPALSLLLARRLGCPAVAYHEPDGAIFRLFERSLPVAGPRAVGDLRTDAWAEVGASRERVDENRADGLVLALFPGSRALLVRHFLPFQLLVASTLSRSLPGLGVLVTLSDLVTAEAFLAALEGSPGILPGSRARLLGTPGPGGTLEVEGLPPVPIVRTGRALREADFGLAPVGSVTGEAAAAGLPLVALLPTHDPALVPIPGLAGQLRRLPFVGRGLHATAFRTFVARRPLVALPNLRAGRPLVPEVRGDFGTEEVVTALLGLAREIQDGAARARLANGLRSAMGPAGAAGRILAELEAVVA
ncbi:MAG TPA: hypothetical protein PLP50_01780 [Thermoanaerobaculia bacterium]|nr:hypothetical protein [Thermoanaerobaculia bacterium]HQN06984.1 hypothetical protein [Thermoanaerobaculia bacterium]HQP84980.1 hypothetical protein [Thermoanaerobaculia bacterium]